jgi:hypothetical protein
MLKQIGKAILPESIKAFSTASAANRSLHSSCNFNTILRQTHFAREFPFAPCTLAVLSVPQACAKLRITTNDNGED